MSTSDAVPATLDELPEYIQELRNENVAFRGDLNETMEHIGWMIQKTLIIEQRLAWELIHVKRKLPMFPI